MKLCLDSLRALPRLAAGALIAFTLAACGPVAPEFTGTDITGTHLGRDLALTDFNGQPRTLADFDGKVTVVFFGFTHCPDVCPTALAEMAQVMKQLGRDADHVQVLLVSVDPQRDTPAVLKQYVTTFDPRFLGLTGTDEQLKKTASSFKAYYAKSPAKDGGYTVDHTAAFYLLDKSGEARVLVQSNVGVGPLTHDIKALLD